MPPEVPSSTRPDDDLDHWVLHSLQKHARGRPRLDYRPTSEIASGLHRTTFEIRAALTALEEEGRITQAQNQFGTGWRVLDGCTSRHVVQINRDSYPELAGPAKSQVDHNAKSQVDHKRFPQPVDNFFSAVPGERFDLEAFQANMLVSALGAATGRPSSPRLKAVDNPEDEHSRLTTSLCDDEHPLGDANASAPSVCSGLKAPAASRVQGGSLPGRRIVRGRREHTTWDASKDTGPGLATYFDEKVSACLVDDDGVGGTGGWATNKTALARQFSQWMIAGVVTAPQIRKMIDQFALVYARSGRSRSGSAWTEFLNRREELLRRTKRSSLGSHEGKQERRWAAPPPPRDLDAERTRRWA